MGAEDQLEGLVFDTAGIEMRMRKFATESGGAASLARSVLSMVANQAYEHSIGEIEAFIKLKNEYPAFDQVTERYVERAGELVLAIREKREIPGIENLSMAKRQAINDSTMSLMEDLRNVLRRIEKTEYNMRMEDLRSTLIVVKTGAWCVLSVIVLAFLLEVYNGLYSTTGVVADEMIGEAVDWTFDKVGM